MDKGEIGFIINVDGSEIQKLKDVLQIALKKYKIHC